MLIRNNAHKFQFAAEDFGTERQLRQSYQAAWNELCSHLLQIGDSHKDQRAIDEIAERYFLPIDDEPEDEDE